MMLVVRKVVRAIKKALSPVSDRGWHVIQEWTPGAFQADEPVKVDTQLSYFAVFACVTLISSDMGKLRQKLVGKTEDGIWEETSSPAFSPVLRKPNRYQNHLQFKEAWAMSKLTRGNAYALKQRDNRGVVTALYLLDPERVVPLVADDGSIFYRLNKDNLSGLEDAQVVVPASEIIHDRMNCLFHPLVGISPLYACALTSQQGLAIQRQGKNFFGNGARPSGILTAPGEIGDPTAERLKTYWQEEFTGDNSGKVAVLGDGLKYEPMVMKSSDAQLIEQLKLTGEQICSAFRVPAFKVGIGTMPTFQNGELLDQIYYNNCLQSLIEQYEACMDDGLGIGEGVVVNGRELGVELDLDGLMRMDNATMFKTLGEGVKASVLKVNEARRRLNLPKVEGGDFIWAQEQNWPLAQLAERHIADAQPEPAATGNKADDALDPETVKNLSGGLLLTKLAAK